MSKKDEVQLQFVYQLETRGLITQNELANCCDTTTMIDYGTR